jgi:sugar-specific transcriptional regulator TrmB
VTREASRHFRNKKREYLKDESNELATNTKNKNIRETCRELIQARGETLVSAIRKLINSIWNKEELPDQWKEAIIIPIRKNGDKTHYNNFRGMSLLSTS